MDGVESNKCWAMGAKETPETVLQGTELSPQGRHTTAHGWGNKCTVTEMWWDRSLNWGKQWRDKSPSVRADREEQEEVILSVLVQLRHMGLLCEGRWAWLNRECLLSQGSSTMSLSVLKDGIKEQREWPEKDESRITCELSTISRAAPSCAEEAGWCTGHSPTKTGRLWGQGRSLTMGKKQMTHLSSVKTKRIVPYMENKGMGTLGAYFWTRGRRWRWGTVGALLVWFDQG